ncbi:MAG TPA: hypothetical protein VGU02_09285 [Gaiellaceae bacterium]|nr:hypothetical protein [Gaiellaceae bacterium]
MSALKKEARRADNASRTMEAEGVKLTMSSGATLELSHDDIQALLRLLDADADSAPEAAVSLRIRLLGSRTLPPDASLELTLPEENALYRACGRAPLDNLAST